jgi:hypothetical protein
MDSGDRGQRGTVQRDRRTMRQNSSGKSGNGTETRRLQ